MTQRPLRNVAASVHQRLLNLAQSTGRPFNELVQYYAIERFLFRLSKSRHGERFVLKGALMLLVWRAGVTRPTRDIDLLGRMSNDLEAVRTVIAEVCRQPVDDDGLSFDPDSVATEHIAENADYEGVRAKFRGRLGNARLAMQVDIGFTDVITPEAVRITYPSMLQQPAAELEAYNRETTIAEKYEAMVKLGELNSRMKDFFDVWLLAGGFEFDGPTLAKAIRKTFTRRQTELAPEPVCFTDRFARDPTKTAQWNAFVRNIHLNSMAPEFPEIIEHVKAFLQPLVIRIAANDEVDIQWQPGGPWRRH